MENIKRSMIFFTSGIKDAVLQTFPQWSNVERRGNGSQRKAPK